MVNIRDVDTEINIYPIEKTEKMSNTAYDVWLEMHIEFMSKGIKFNAVWGGYIFDLQEPYENLIKMKKNHHQALIYFP